ncbi:MAG TPA: N-acetyltransferase [Vicinamibacterales bacterium]|jgi:putative acetyltransferase|nr:N-acetyltransferase [Vicinamibacterales bacterium]
MIAIRPETTDDGAATYAVYDAAFGRSDESHLVRRLRRDADVIAGLTAVADGVAGRVAGHVVGHILFSRVTIHTRTTPIPGVALAPMAVLPSHQRRGIGSALVREGIRTLRARHERVILVLGHQDYYPRFGFSADLARGLLCRFSGPAFMALELEAGVLDGVVGDVSYPAAFGPD